jgi:glycosyltransferase involved in cell wall biosynthesis
MKVFRISKSRKSEFKRDKTHEDDPPRRILIVTVSWPHGNGEFFIEDELSAICDLGIDVTVIPLRPNKEKISEFGNSNFGNVRVVSSSFFPRKFLPDLYRFFVKKPRNTYLLIKEIAILMGDPKNFLRNALCIPKVMLISTVISVYGVSHVHGYWASTPATAAMMAARISKVNWSFTAHRGDLYANNLGKRKSKCAQFIRHISMRGISDWRELGNFGNSKYIPLGTLTIESDIKQKTNSLSNLAREIVIVCPASLIPVKGHEILFRALELMDESNRPKLFLYGEGYLEGTLRRRVKSLGIEGNVHFMGQLPRNDLLRVYGDLQSPLVVIPSLELSRTLHEGVPFSLVEAMGLGVPVVSTKSGSIDELLGSLKSSLVEPGNFEMLKIRIEDFQFRPDLYRDTSIASRKVIAESRDARKTSEALISFMFEDRK